MTIRYGACDLDLIELLKPWFGEAAELVRIQSLDDDGKHVRAVFKADDLEGGASCAAGDLPSYDVTFDQAVHARFVRRA